MIEYSCFWIVLFQLFKEIKYITKTILSNKHMSSAQSSSLYIRILDLTMSVEKHICTFFLQRWEKPKIDKSTCSKTCYAH